MLGIWQCFTWNNFFYPYNDVRAVHDFKAGTIIEGDESASKLFCWIMVNWVDYPTEVFPVELTNLVNIPDPNGNMFNLHRNLYKQYT